MKIYHLYGGLEEERYKIATRCDNYHTIKLMSTKYSALINVN